jgi:uncharacterized SAM-binding protein YcdF (DUF218 family)
MENLFSFGFLALPTAFITLALAGALLALKWRRLGVALALASSLCLFAAATPALASCLLRWAEAPLPRQVDVTRAQAIVVLSGDQQRGNGADIPDELGPLSLRRVVWAADAYRRLHLPVAVSGGRGSGDHVATAALMKTALETEFAVPVAFVEDRSHTTWENAVETARLLLPAGLRTVVLVSDAWHLPRAVWAFDRVGFTALPWPAPRTALHRGRFGDFLPSLTALQDTFDALHELIGRLYYRLRH